MSKYETQFDEDKIICPYCGHSYRAEAGDFDEDAEVEECDNCGKLYHLFQEISVTHRTQPDCALNGKEHEYEDKILSGSKTHPFCIVCGKIKPLEKIK